MAPVDRPEHNRGDRLRRYVLAVGEPPRIVAGHSDRPRQGGPSGRQTSAVRGSRRQPNLRILRHGVDHGLRMSRHTVTQPPGNSSHCQGLL